MLLRTLLAKDLRRTRRNPVSWLITLVLPFMITGLVGLAFAPRGGQATVRISVALVDQDDSPLTRFLRGALNQDNARQHLDVHFLDRAEAERRVTENLVAAAVIIPEGFSDAYMSNRAAPPLQVIKNPAQGMPPAIVEEGVQIVATLLNAAARVLGEDLADVRALFAEDKDFLTVLADASLVLVNTREKLLAARDYLTPPLIQYDTETRNGSTVARNEMGNTFRYILVGMMGMFLLMMADSALRDLYREGRFHTLERFRTARVDLLGFVIAKATFAFATQWAGVVAFLGGGTLLFGIEWQRPFALLALVLAYTLFGAGFMGLVAALAGTERRANALTSIVIMVLAAAGGCMFPPNNFPAFLREGLMPLLPTAWFAATARALQEPMADPNWVLAALKLAAAGGVSLVLATRIFQRRLESGVRP